jgi:hypothetical protein
VRSNIVCVAAQLQGEQFAGHVDQDCCSEVAVASICVAQLLEPLILCWQGSVNTPTLIVVSNSE